MDPSHNVTLALTDLDFSWTLVCPRGMGSELRVPFSLQRWPLRLKGQSPQPRESAFPIFQAGMIGSADPHSRCSAETAMAPKPARCPLQRQPSHGKQPRLRSPSSAFLPERLRVPIQPYPPGPRDSAQMAIEEWPR